MGPRTTSTRRSRVGRRLWLAVGGLRAVAAWPSPALARAGSGSSAFGRSLGRGGGYGGRGYGGGHHFFFFGGGGGGGGLLLLVIVVVVLLFLASRRGGGRRRRRF
jgi:uncharacterized membrane protein